GLTGLSGGAPEPADPVAGAEHDVQPVAFVDATGPVDRAPPVRPYSPEKRVLDPGSGADAWVAGDPTLDGTPPVAQTTHPHGRYTSLMTLNRGSIRRDFEPVTGVVSVTMWVRPPMGSTPIRIGMLIDGTADPLNGLGVYIEKDDADQWSYPRQSVPASGVAPAAQRDRERERVASYENRVYALELVQDTRRGSFDVWLDGARVARDVARPWTQGLPVTGVYIGGGKARTREGQALYFGDVTATARRWDGPATATEVRWAAAPPIAVAWGERPLHVLEEQLTTALATRDVAGARVVADRMSARFGGSPEAADAERRVTEGEIEVAGMQPAATEGRDRVRSAVNALGRDKRARTTDDAFAEWARANASVTHAQWDAWLEDRLGGKHVYVGFLPEHYVDRTHLFHMACEVVRAYHFMNADYTGSIGVEVRNPAGGERSLVGANSWDLGDEFHRRHAPGGEPPTPFYPVTRFVLGRGGEVYANQTSALLRSADGGVNWRREDTAAQRVEAFCEDDGVVYGRQYGAGALLARGPAGIWGPVNPTPAAALVAAGFLGELSTPDIDPRVGHSAEADGRRDVTGVTWSDGAAYALSDGVVTLRDAVYPIRAWRVVVTPNNVNIVGAEAAFRARYTDSIVDRDWLWDNDRIREAELATADPPPGLDWLDVVAAPDGWVDLEAQLRPTAPNGLTTGYMVCYIDSPDARRLALNTMRTGALGIWVNGQRIPDAWHVGDESRDNTVSVPVRPGRNALMIKMGRLGSQWGVQARFLPEGMDGVRVASVADAQGVLPAPVARDVWLHMNHMLASRVVPALHVSDGRLCAATDDGVWVFAPDDFRWARSARGVEEGADFVYALTTHGGAVYSARKSGVFRLDPDTDVWEARGAGMDDHHVRSIVSAHGVLLAGTHQGRIYLSADDGRNWTRVHGHEPAARL
ncbi:hypothetical protein HOI71_05680, partial [Candidatus Poribacteria bacterium]|nr:hypothetical protein [Candidatus Poribacteria bacterium]